MLVYGDPQFRGRVRSFLDSLEDQVASVIPGSLDDMRALLIQVGQLEQAVLDCWTSPNREEQPWLDRIAELTDAAAVCFYNAWSRACGRSPSQAQDSRTAHVRMRQALKDNQVCPTAEVTVKIPEGFEFYALFPEQYCMAVQRWAGHHTGTWPKRVLVVGIRSIGTTLSAVAAAALRAEGWEVTRLTVRPGGHPFNREVVLPEAEVRDVPCALVVDEGPGISGSSMAATAQALAEEGIPDISFLPGHAGEPGHAASPEVRHWWAKAPRYVVRLDELRWQGLALAELLAAKADDWSGNPSRFVRIRDLSVGRWRNLAFPNGEHWPASSGPFERMKILCTDTQGRSVLWKFAGLGCAVAPASYRFSRATSGNRLSPRRAERGIRVEKLAPIQSMEVALSQMRERAAAGLSPAPLGALRGFIATPWVEGTRLSANDRTAPSVINHLGKYLSRTAEAPLEREEWQASIERLANMLCWNTKEALGDALAELTKPWAEAARRTPPGPTYGDGRMAPHEWVRTPEGVILKTDGIGHDWDHTLVGRQSVLWDLAGLLVEWGLDWADAGTLAERLQTLQHEPAVLRFYQLAYSAFRLGLTALCAAQCHNPAEQVRLRRASESYKTRLAHLLMADKAPCGAFTPLPYQRAT